MVDILIQPISEMFAIPFEITSNKTILQPVQWPLADFITTMARQQKKEIWYWKYQIEYLGCLVCSK